MPVEIPTEMMINALDKCCDGYRRCVDCELKLKYDKEVKEYTDNYGCQFESMDEQMIEKIYCWYKELDPADCENVEAECCDKELNVDMVNHHKNIVEEMHRLFDLFDDNVEIFINKFNKTVDIHIQM